MICPIETGTTFNCEDRKNAAGVEHWCYVGNRPDITFTKSLNGTITDVTMLATTFLYKIEGPQKAFDASIEKQTSDVAGTISYKHTVNLMLSAMNQISVSALQNLVEANDLVFFMPTKGKHVFVYGADGGMSCDTFKESLGKTGTDNNLADISFMGESNDMKIEMLSTDYDSTIELLDGLIE